MNSLGLRVVALLSLALLPIGLIAVHQTSQVSKAARHSAEQALLARTEQAARGERLVIEQARGAAWLLGSMTGLLNDQQACQANLAAFTDANSRFSFIGVLPASGIMTCSSSGRVVDLTGNENFNKMVLEQRPTVTVNTNAPISGTSVISVAEPLFVDREFQGMISVSIPHERLDALTEKPLEEGLVNVISFNIAGDILTAAGPLEDAEDDLPMVGALEDLLGQGAYSFSANDRRGNDRIYAIVPIIKDTVYVIGVWDVSLGTARQLIASAPPATFPILMWLASLGVALFAVHQLVIRHVRELGDRMRRFARNRSLEEGRSHASASAELAEMDRDFRDMAASIIQDEAELEDALHDKNVLIKEVHHRVKNNLQLISSIMNMQIRKSGSPETKAVLGQVQDRVLSLATIHRDLYQSQNAGRVNASTLISEIIEKTVEIGSEDQGRIALRKSIAPILLYPDQAVPLSLLVAEAVTNAMKYLGPDSKGKRWIDVTLVQDHDDSYSLRIGNSLGVPKDASGTGLGNQLIKAFAMQLGGQIEVEQSDDAYWLRMTFAVAEFTSAPVDY